jgi:hypothetical protein
VLRAMRALRTRRCSSSDAVAAVTVAGTSERGAVVARARELIEFARVEGYRVDVLIEIIESVG